jgi:hypothetical protein
MTLRRWLIEVRCRQAYEEVFELEGAMNVGVLFAFEGTEQVQGRLEAAMLDGIHDDEPDHSLPTRSATVR